MEISEYMGRNGERHWTITIRVKIEEYDRLREAHRKTTFRSFSGYLRALVLKKPVIAYYRNQSIDNFMPVALGLKNSLDTSIRSLGNLIKAFEASPLSTENGQLIDHLLAEEVSLRRHVEEIRNLLVKLTEQ